jgi:hypothetical protein
MVVYTLDTRFNSITLGGSKALGAPITVYEIIPILLGRDDGRAAGPDCRRTARPSQQPGQQSGAEAAAPNMVMAELVLRPAGGRGRQSGGKAGRQSGGKAADAAATGWVAGVRGHLRRRWMPACAMAIEDSGAEGEVGQAQG